MCAGARVTDEDMALVRDLCSGFSQTEVISEHLLDVVTAVSGSSPAYVFMFIEAMADAAVADGMPRQQAYNFAAQAVLGSAKMVLETGKHPGELKDMVCSPAGTTIQAVRVLEEKRHAQQRDRGNKTVYLLFLEKMCRIEPSKDLGEKEI